MSTSQDRTPRSPTKADLLSCAQELVAQATGLKDVLADHTLPEALRPALHTRLAALLQETANIKEEAYNAALAAAPQAPTTAVVLSNQQMWEGLGKIGSLPLEVRREVWGHLDRRSLGRAARLSRAANAEALPLLLSNISVGHETTCLRQLANVMRRLSLLDTLCVERLSLRWFDDEDQPRDELSAVLAHATPKLQHLSFTSVLESELLAHTQAPRLHQLELDLSGNLERDGWGDLRLEGLEAIFERMVPAAERLHHVKLVISLYDADSDDEDDEEPDDDFISLELDTGQLVRNHSHLKSLTVCTTVPYSPDVVLHFSIEELETASNLSNLSAIALSQVYTRGLVFATDSLKHIVQMSGRLTHFFLDANLRHNDPDPVHFPLMPHMRNLAIPAECVEALPGSVAIDKLDSLTLLESYTDLVPSLASGLMTLQGALEVGSVDGCKLLFSPDNTALPPIRHLRLQHKLTLREAVDLKLPLDLETLCLPAAVGDVLLVDTPANIRKSNMNDLFIRLPDLSLVVVDHYPGSFVRSASPDEHGYIFEWSSKDYARSKWFHKLFGTLTAYEEQWWED